jgi:hypothetical protein
MKNTELQNRIVRLGAAILLIGIGGAGDYAYAQDEPDEWQYALTPYLWLPTIDGALNYGPPPGGGGSPNISVGPTDWLDLLNFGLLVSGSAKKGRYSVFSDLVYLSLESKDGRVISVDDAISMPGAPVQLPNSPSFNLNTKTELDGLVWMVAGGYTIEETSSSTMDLFGGVRYFGVDVSTRWNLTSDITPPGGGVILPAEGSIGQDTDLWDVIVGIRGEFDWTSEKWSTPYYLDFGTGSSNLTWQAMAGLSYSFGWGDFILMYRHLEYDQGSNRLMQDFSFGGPAFGARFSF